MSCKKTFRKAVVAAAVAAPFTAAMATNGMNMEGYGPVSTGMGGASQAYDHGTAGMAQNPATLSLMSDKGRLDAAIGILGPRVSSSMAGMPTADSEGTSYLMPALGYARRNGDFVYGLGLMAQGGMGTEYSATSFLAAGSGSPVRSELGVGKLIVPLSYQVNSKLAVGASLDFMWAGLDLMMAASGSQLAGMVTGGSGGIATAAGSLAAAPWARVDFSDGDKNTGAAKATGYAAKLGAVYKFSDAVSVGGSYQLKSSLGDMKTAAGSASMSGAGGFSDTGTITVVNFQWPSIAAIGASWQAAPSVLVAADVKSIGWAEVMKNFNMRYDSITSGGYVTFALPQNWKDQTVLNLGVAWKASSALTLRGGVNLADNPIPDAYVNPLFPATVKSHYSAGLGYQFTANDEFNMSYVMAPRVSVTNASGVVVEHAQSNVQLMYSHRY